MSVYTDRLADLTPEQKVRAEWVRLRIEVVGQRLALLLAGTTKPDHFADNFGSTLGGQR